MILEMLKAMSVTGFHVSVNIPICSVCQELGVFSQHLPLTALQCDIRCEGECRLDEVPIEVAPCEKWLLDEVETGYSQCPSTAKLLKQMVSEVDTETSRLTPM